MNVAQWRTPHVVLACSGVILMLSLGIRHTFGLFLQPMTMDHGWGRETFAFAIAAQNLIWGLGQPVAGAIADRFGSARVIGAAAVLYAVGLAMMAGATTASALNISAGLLIGFAMSGAGYGVVMGAVGRVFPAARRGMALGIAAACGSFGQFATLPFAQSLISVSGWVNALCVLAACALLIVPLAAVYAGNGGNASARSQTFSEALREAATHCGFWLLSLGMFVCGLRTTFIMVHLPAYLLDQGLTARDGMLALALLAFFNIVGSYFAGALGDRYRKKYVLALYYGLPAIAITLFVMLPLSTTSTVVFGILMGLGWLGALPLTNALVAQIFGVRYLATLISVPFLAHQIGAFLGVWYGGYAFDTTGTYTSLWIIVIGLSIVAAVLCLPIDERELAGQPVRTPAT